MLDLNWYALDPIDLLLLRESKPFSPGDGSWAKGQFPPLPTTVFQAMRSATPWQGDKSNRKRDLEFVGPFLLYAPPGEPESLWLPTPQDLVCVRTFSQADDLDSNNETEEDFTEVASQWERTARFQPLDRHNLAWKYLGFDPDFFPEDSLVPMVPPVRMDHVAAAEGATSLEENLNRCLRTIDDKNREGIAGRPLPWIRADALVRYLQGEVLENNSEAQSESLSPKNYFYGNPWSTQVLPHIKVQPGTRQVAEEEGYFTEVAIRMEPHWHLVAGISATLDAKVVRLGGEGHRVLVSKMPAPPPQWESLIALRSPSTADEPTAAKSTGQTAYVLTPGLAETAEEQFGLIPTAWRSELRSCVGDRALLWGGMSVFQKLDSKDKSVAFQPQRAFVPPGTIYRFHPGQLPDELIDSSQDATDPPKLLPTQGGNWLKTLNSLNYGILLWGQ